MKTFTIYNVLMALALGSASVLAIPNPNPETATIGSTEPASQDTSEIVDVAKRSEVVSIEKRDYRACVTCVIACAAARGYGRWQANFNTGQQVMSCLGYCTATGACNSLLCAYYTDYYRDGPFGLPRFPNADYS